MSETLTAAQSLCLFGEIIRDQNGTVLNPFDVILTHTDNDTAGPRPALVYPAGSQPPVETTVTVERPEPTPEQLAATTIHSRGEWNVAYWQLGDREDWPELVDWVRRGWVQPRELSRIAVFLETPMSLDQARQMIEQLAE